MKNIDIEVLKVKFPCDFMKPRVLNTHPNEMQRLEKAGIIMIELKRIHAYYGLK